MGRGGAAAGMRCLGQLQSTGDDSDPRRPCDWVAVAPLIVGSRADVTGEAHASQAEGPAVSFPPLSASSMNDHPKKELEGAPEKRGRHTGWVPCLTCKPRGARREARAPRWAHSP